MLRSGTEQEVVYLYDLAAVSFVVQIDVGRAMHPTTLVQDEGKVLQGSNITKT